MLLQLLNHAESCTLHVHGTIIWRGITCKKTPCYMCDSVAGGLLLKMLNIYAKYFWIFPLKRNCRILIGLCKVFMNRPIIFLDRDNKTKLVPAYLIFRLDHVFSRRFGQRLQPIFRQFVNLINHNKIQWYSRWNTSNRILSEEKKQKKLINANVITRHNAIVVSCDE